MVTIDPNLNLAFRTPGSHTVMGGENVISIARKYNMSTKIGAALDMVSDVITNSILLISILRTPI